MPAIRPLITKTSRPFWDALDEGRIEIQQCERCTKWVFYPRNICPYCGAMDLCWKIVSGKASLYTFTVAIAPVSIDFLEDAPLLLAVAELAEGVHIPTTLVDVATDDIKIGMDLEPVFDRVRLGDITLLRFKPAGNASASR